VRLSEPDNANGVASFSPGLARRRSAYPGTAHTNANNPNGIESAPHPPFDATPLGLFLFSGTLTQGSSFLATLG